MIDLLNYKERGPGTTICKRVIHITTDDSNGLRIQSGRRKFPREQALLTETMLRVFERIVSSLL